MKTLFVHQNFPGQFKRLAPALINRPGAEVVAMCMHDRPLHDAPRVVRYRASRSSNPAIHPWVADIKSKAIRGEAAFRAALALRGEGFDPDVIVAHPGWGESLFLKEVWPRARMGLYCEFYYRTEGLDAGFDPEFELPADSGACRLMLKNINNLLHFELAKTLGLSPDVFRQASTFPARFHEKISRARRCGHRANPAQPRRAYPTQPDAGAGPRQRGHYLRESQPGALPRLSRLHAHVARNPAPPAQGTGGDRRRRQGRVWRGAAARRDLARQVSWTRSGAT